MDEDSLVTVYTLSDPNQAEVIRVALESEGIPCEIGSENQGGLSGLGICKIQVLVAAKDQAAAQAYLKEHHAP